MNLHLIQTALKDAGLDGWLFYDFHHRDPIAEKILSIDKNRIFTRRWYYFIPTEGEPKKLVHKIEPYNLDHLPGPKYLYLEWQLLHKNLRLILGNSKRIAMQYSPYNMLPYVCIVDGGTLELIRSFGIDVMSSGNLVSLFESHLTDEGIESHIGASKVIHFAKEEAFREIGRRIKENEQCTEYEIYKYMESILENNGMYWDMGPIVSVNEHNADPHFEPTTENSLEIREGDTVMIDVWAKFKQPDSIFADITWMGYVGNTVPDELEAMFQITCKARNSALALLYDRFENGTPVYGWEVDDASRNIIKNAGYGDNFTHRTGHNIGEEVHGPGVHIDNLETMDDRRIINGSCFSIEPGIYLPEQKNGFRTEMDVYITNDGDVKIACPMQEKIIPILSMH